MKKLLFGAALVAIGVIVLVAANPFESGQVEYSFDDSALRIAIEGTWHVTIDSSPPRELTLTIRQAKGEAATQHSSRSFVRAANACSHRTFVRSAEACLDVSELPIEVRIAGSSTPTKGELLVLDPVFVESRLTIPLNANETLFAKVSPIGEATDVSYSMDAHYTNGRMVRTAAH